MARQRTPDISRVPPQGPWVADPPDLSLRGFLRRRRKAIAAIVSLPVAFVFLKLGIGDAVGVELSSEAETGIVSIVVGLIVERVPNAEA